VRGVFDIKLANGMQRLLYTLEGLHLNCAFVRRSRDSGLI
jgi:hypothetical protein